MVENERVAKVEQAIQNIDKGFSRLEQKFDNVLAQIEKRYVSRSENSEVIKRLEERISDQDDRIGEINTKLTRQFGYLITIAGTVVAALLQYVLGHK